jgi:hypothetical protein
VGISAPVTEEITDVASRVHEYRPPLGVFCPSVWE